MEENTPATNTAQPGKKSSRLAILCILIAGSLWGCLGLFNRNLSAWASPRRRWSCCETWGLRDFGHPLPDL